MGIDLRRRIASLEYLEQSYESVEAEYHNKVAELEKEFYAQATRLHARRQQIIEGKAIPVDEEVNASSLAADLENNLPDSAVAVEPGRVPSFWPTALRVWLNMSMEVMEVTDQDWQALNYLREVRSELWNPPADLPTSQDEAEPSMGGETEPSMGYAIRMFFDENPYFDVNEELAIFVNDTGQVVDVTAPRWKEGKDLTLMYYTKKVKKKNKPAQKLEKTKKTSSFFRLFEMPVTPDFYDLEGRPRLKDDVGQDTLFAHAQLQQDLVFGLKEGFVPRAGQFFLQALSSTEGEGSELHAEEE